MRTKLILMSIAILGLTFSSGCKKEVTPADLVPKTVDEDPTLPSININGTKLHAETFGNPDSAMVILLHGGPGGDYRSMLNCRDLAANGYFVVFYDQRGSGLSRRHNKNTYSIDLMLNDLSSVIEYYRRSPNQKVFLFGHSWGAMLATAYVNKYPTAISGVILAEPGGFTWNQTKEYLKKSREGNMFGEEFNDVFYDDQFFTGDENDHDKLDYKLALSSAHDFAKGNVLGIAGPWPFWRWGAVISNSMKDIAERQGFDFTTNLNQFHTKVLFAYSERNTAYGLAHAQLLSASYSNVQLELIRGTGHEMMYFGWNNFYPIVLTYLNNLK